MGMKRITLVIIFLLTVFFPVIAAAEEAYDFSSLENSIIPYVQLDIMCSMNAFLEPGECSEMRQYSAELDPFYKDLLFDRYSQDPWGVAAVNLFTGGMGSLLNGNIVTGTILQAGFLGSYTFMVLGLMEQDPSLRSTDLLIAEIGAVVFGLAGVILPFVETSSHNEALKEGLNL